VCGFMLRGFARLSRLSSIGGGRARCHSVRDWKCDAACATTGCVAVLRSSATYAASWPSSPTFSIRVVLLCSVCGEGG
jgi:hypothetical protein